MNSNVDARSCSCPSFPMSERLTVAATSTSGVTSRIVRSLMTVPVTDACEPNRTVISLVTLTPVERFAYRRTLALSSEKATWIMPSSSRTKEVLSPTLPTDATVVTCQLPSDASSVACLRSNPDHVWYMMCGDPAPSMAMTGSRPSPVASTMVVVHCPFGTPVEYRRSSFHSSKCARWN